MSWAITETMSESLNALTKQNKTYTFEIRSKKKIRIVCYK